MKRIILALALLVMALPALADDGIFYPTKTQALPYDATAKAVTSAISGYIGVVRLLCTTDCFIADEASDGVSTTTLADNLVSTNSTTTRLPANTPEYFGIGTGRHILVIRVTSNGTLYVTEMSK